MIRTTTLDSGLQVVTEKMSDCRSVALSFWVGTGSRDESDAEWGMSHFLEHLLFKGSKTRSALEIARTIDAMGGDMNAFTTRECTAFYVRVLAQEAEMALDILCDLMCAPAFDATEVEAEREVVLEEILMHNDEPADIAQELFSATLFAGHPLAREILGDESGIRSMSGAEIEAFFDHHYRPGNLVFAAAGDVDHDELCASVDRHWSGRTGGCRPQRTPPTVRTGERIEHLRPTDQTHLLIGTEAPHRHDRRRYAVSLLDTILGGGMSSRLFQEVRESRGLAYTVYSGYTPYDDTGELSIYLGTGPRRAVEAAKVVFDVLADVQANGVTERELELAKRHLRATTALGLEDSAARMSRIGRSLLLHGDVLDVDEVMGRMEAVTIDEVGQLAAELFDLPVTTVSVGPRTGGIS